MAMLQQPQDLLHGSMVTMDHMVVPTQPSLAVELDDSLELIGEQSVGVGSHLGDAILIHLVGDVLPTPGEL